MDTDRLRYFCAVAQTSNLHRAAELLRISPAALSKSIKILESEVGVKLITPSGRGIDITEAGRELALRGEKLLAEMGELKTSLSKTHSQKRTLKLGSFEVFTTYFLGPLLDKGFGEYDFVLHELTPGHLEESIALRHIDLGVTYIPIPRAELDFMRVTQIRMGTYARKNLYGGKEMSEIPFAIPVTPIKGSPSKVVGLDGWPDHLIKRNIKYRVTLMESALELCRQGASAGFFPDFVIDLHNKQVLPEFRLHRMKFEVPAKYLYQPVYVVKRKSDLEGDVVKKMASLLRSVCRQQ